MTVPRALLAGLLAAVLAGCGSTGVQMPTLSDLSLQRTPDNVQIATVLQDVHNGMETRRIFKVLAHVSRNYRDQAGRDYNGIQAYLQDFFERYRDISITRAKTQIQVQGDQARALETFGTRARAANPDEDIDIHLQGQVTVTLERIEGQWKIVEWGSLL